MKGFGSLKIFLKVGRQRAGCVTMQCICSCRHVSSALQLLTQTTPAKNIRVVSSALNRGHTRRLPGAATLETSGNGLVCGRYNTLTGPLLADI